MIRETLPYQHIVGIKSKYLIETQHEMYITHI